jgi:hypothetical protein
VISADEGDEAAHSMNAEYWETSAKTSEYLCPQGGIESPQYRSLPSGSSV